MKVCWHGNGAATALTQNTADVKSRLQKWMTGGGGLLKGSKRKAARHLLLLSSAERAAKAVCKYETNSCEKTSALRGLEAWRREAVCELLLFLDGAVPAINRSSGWRRQHRQVHSLILVTEPQATERQFCDHRRTSKSRRPLSSVWLNGNSLLHAHCSMRKRFMEA